MCYSEMAELLALSKYSCRESRSFWVFCLYSPILSIHKLQQGPARKLRNSQIDYTLMQESSYELSSIIWLEGTPILPFMPTVTSGDHLTVSTVFFILVHTGDRQICSFLDHFRQQRLCSLKSILSINPLTSYLESVGPSPLRCSSLFGRCWAGNVLSNVSCDAPGNKCIVILIGVSAFAI